MPSLMKFKNYIIIAAAASVALLQSCKRDGVDNPAGSGTNTPITSIDQMVVPNNFDYATTHEVMLDVFLADGVGDAFKGVKVCIYDNVLDPTLKKPNLLYTGVTGADGKLTGAVSLPTYLKSVFIYPYSVGIPNNVSIPVVNKSVTFKYSNGKIQSRIEAAKNYHDISNPANATLMRKSGVADKFSKRLGTWNSSGVPNYLESQGDNLTQAFLNKITASFPESRSVPNNHPDYLLETNQRNLKIDSLSDVFITFVHEGAGYQNSLFYYVYHKDSVPTSVNDIDSLIAIFPNCSFSGSGGGLNAGNKVKIGRFKAGYVIGLAIAANGYNDATDQLTAGYNIWYTNKEFNNESGNWKQHTALLYDDDTKRFVIGFEDLKRDNSSSDEDFNDVIIFATSNPVDAIDDTGVPPIDEPGDCDNDGVTDVYDDFPCDATKAYRRFFPSDTEYGTLSFEDLWPYTGDYDMNDLVLRWQFEAIANASNKVIEFKCKSYAAAKGGSFPIGFGIQFPFNASAVQQVTGSQITRNRVTLTSKGLEQGHTKAVMVLFDEVADQLSATGQSFYNTVNYSPISYPDTIKTVMTFTSPITFGDLGTYPFNPFIFTTNRGSEVHLPDQPNTALANINLFGTGKDNSIPNSNRFYKTSGNLPWAMHLPIQFAYPSERTSIIQAYLNFANWAQSGGAANQNWYLNEQGNINQSKLFTR